MTMKKLFATMMSVAMLVCAAGCQKTPSATVTTPVYKTPEAAGVLFVSVGAEFKVIYDTDGLVIAVDSMSDAAADVVLSLEATLGVPCDQLVSQLVKGTIDAGNHPFHRVVVIKQAPTSTVPNANFLEDVRIDTAAVTDYEVVMIPAEELTANGYITSEAAIDILTRQLKLIDVTMNCVDDTAGAYVLTFELEGAEQEYKINAITGTVFLDSLPGDLSDATENDYQEDYYEEGQVENPGPMEDQ